MSDNLFDTNSQTNEPVQDELATLKGRADMLGIKYASNIGLEKLKAKLEAALSEGNLPDPKEEADTGKVSAKHLKKKELNKLVRVSIVCKNPHKKEWPGEIITVGNSIGTWKKFIPFSAPNGWHIPVIILNAMKERKYQHFYKARDAKGTQVTRSRLVNEFDITYLEDLSEKEIDTIRTRQLARTKLEGEEF